MNFESKKLFFSTSTLVLSMLIATTATKASAGSTSYKVGDCYGGGVIFYVKKTPLSAGHHGLIVAPTDVPHSYAWDTKAGGESVDGTQSRLLSGPSNTAKILKKIGVNRAKAAQATITYKHGAYHDWYLPSQMELMSLYFQAATRGPNFWKQCKATPLGGATYWTSTQYDVNDAVGVSFAGGVVIRSNKSSPLLVRAIRSF